MHQLPLITFEPHRSDQLLAETFSHGLVHDDFARRNLEIRYGPLFSQTDKFNRQTVSFQANKTEVLHRWIKYREGFSSSLVEQLVREFNLSQGDTVFDPFAGSCTTLLVAKVLGINGVGIELLPHCHLAWEAKSHAFDYPLTELVEVQARLKSVEPADSELPFPHLLITQSAFPPQTERDLMAYKVWFDELPFSQDTKTLCRFVLMSILENVSYTRKDGQYLRWDARAPKVIMRNDRRMSEGKAVIDGIDKGELPTVRQCLIEALSRIIHDIKRLQSDPLALSEQTLHKGSTLEILPTLAAEQFNAVITSPPYANRYDYTRTYALELAFLGVDQGIFDLRQRLLSCTVENRSKSNSLELYYQSIGAHERYLSARAIARSNESLIEVSAALKERHTRGEINNSGVLPMIDQYFEEMTMVFNELFRTCRTGAQVAFVNDNVRYAGEIIPVDTISTSLAEAIGFTPKAIYVLPQKKGNSSQQMSRYGRVPLRKSITIWRKP